MINSFRERHKESEILKVQCDRAKLENLREAVYKTEPADAQ
jgi:hypothetical protein